MGIGSVWKFVKETGSDFVADDAMTLAASLAFYTALSFAPLLVLMLTVVTLFLGEATQQKLVDEVKNLMGPQAGASVEQIVNPEKVAGEKGGGGAAEQAKEKQKHLASVAGIVGLVTLIFSASGVFAQLQAAMNRIWDVEPKPGGAVMSWLRSRGLSIGMVFAILFLLLVSLVVSSILAGMFKDGGTLWKILNFIISLGVFIGLFALIFKFLPDVKIPWTDVWIGAAATAVLFGVGKSLIGLYLGTAGVGSSYGAAGSLIVLLVWVYYSSIILFLGAEMTQVYAKWHGSKILPGPHAQPETPKDKRPAVQGS